MMIFGIVLGVGFFAFLIAIAQQVTEMEDYLNEMRMLQNHDLYD